MGLDRRRSLEEAENGGREPPQGRLDRRRRRPARDRIAFNAGLLTDSLVMATNEWQRAMTIEQIFDVAG